MKIERVMRHEVTVDQVYEMSCSKEFQERKCADAGALSWDVKVSVDGDTAVVHDQAQAADRRLPVAAAQDRPVGRDLDRDDHLGRRRRPTARAPPTCT